MDLILKIDYGDDENIETAVLNGDTYIRFESLSYLIQKIIKTNQLKNCKNERDVVLFRKICEYILKNFEDCEHVLKTKIEIDSILGD
jgi:hypothetical protein